MRPVPGPAGLLLALTLTLALSLALALAPSGIVVVAADDTRYSADYSVVAPLASRSLLLAGTAQGESVVLAGERGHVLLSSSDSGWRQARVPARVLLTGMDRQGDILLAVGHDAVILRSGDGGESWTRVHYDPEAEAPLLDVWLDPEGHGFAVGAYGLMLETADWGLTWQRREIVTERELPDAQAEAERYEDFQYDDLDDLDEYIQFHLNDIAPAGDGRLYIAAEAGTVYRSDDGGATWRELPSPYEGSFYGVLPLDHDGALLFGLRGHLYRTGDGGASWNRIESGTLQMLTDGARLADGRVVLVGMGGVVLVSGDGGHAFDLYQRPDRRDLQAIVGSLGNEPWVVGADGVERLDLSALSVPGR